MNNTKEQQIQYLKSAKIYLEENSGILYSKSYRKMRETYLKTAQQLLGTQDEDKINHYVNFINSMDETLPFDPTEYYFPDLNDSTTRKSLKTNEDLEIVDINDSEDIDDLDLVSLESMNNPTILENPQYELLRTLYRLTIAAEKDAIEHKNDLKKQEISQGIRQIFVQTQRECMMKNAHVSTRPEKNKRFHF